MSRKPTGHRVADTARRMGVHPIAPDGFVPPRCSVAAIASNGDVFDIADVLERFEEVVGELRARVEKLETADTLPPDTDPELGAA